MLNPDLNAIKMDIPSTLKLAKGEIFIFAHNLMTNTAHFIRFQNHSGYFDSFIRFASVGVVVRNVSLGLELLFPIPFVVLIRTTLRGCVFILDNF